MSYSSTVKSHEKLDNKDTFINLPSNNSNNGLLLSKKLDDDSSSTSLLSDSSLSSIELTPQQIPNRRVVKSCFWSTTVFSINFISSILVINLSKW